MEVGDQRLGLDSTAKDPEEELSNDPYLYSLLSLFYTSLISILMVLSNSTIV